MKGNRDNFFSFLYENIRYDPLLELSQQEGSNEGSQCMFYLKNRENYPIYPFLSGALLYICSNFGRINSHLII